MVMGDTATSLSVYQRDSGSPTIVGLKRPLKVQPPQFVLYFSLSGYNQQTYLQCPAGDEETDDLLVEIECLTSQVMRETSLWNLQIHAERVFEDNSEVVKYEDEYKDNPDYELMSCTED